MGRWLRAKGRGRGVGRVRTALGSGASQCLGRRILALVGLVLAAGWASVGQAQNDDPEHLEQVLAKYEAYLERKPLHGFALERYLEAARKLGRLDSILERLEGRLERDPHGRAARVIYGRLLAEVDRENEAIVALSAMEDPGPGVQGLLGILNLRIGEAQEAVRHLEASLADRKDVEAWSERARTLAEAHLALGNRGAAAEALLGIGRERASSYTVRFGIAEELARHGWVEEALGEWSGVEELAGKDSARLCQVFAAKGRLLERNARIPEALEVYGRALNLMGRGHWLETELRGRVLSIHQRSGSLESHEARLRQRIADQAGDLGAREYLARTLVLDQRIEEARDVLAEAAAAFPRDVVVSDRLRTQLRALGEEEQLVREYQRILGEHPERVELYAELAELLAAQGRLAEARRQWEKTLGQRLGDAGDYARLAETYARWDLDEEAIGLWRKAIELDPGDLGVTGALVRFLGERDRGEEVIGILEVAESKVSDVPEAIEKLATLWMDVGQPERARASLELALNGIKGRPDGGNLEARLRGRLGSLWKSEGRVDRAEEEWRIALDLVTTAPLRMELVDRILLSWGERDALEELREGELARQTRERGRSPEERNSSPWWLLAELDLRVGTPGDAIGNLRELLDIAPGEAGARRQLAGLLEDHGETGLALEEWERIAVESPAERRSALERVAELHLDRFDQTAALATYSRLLEGTAGNAAAFARVGELQVGMGRFEEAVEAFRQAVSLEPEREGYRLAFAELLGQLGEDELAREQIDAALANPEPSAVEAALDALHGHLSGLGSLERELEELRRRIDEDPYDFDAPRRLVGLQLRESEYGLALETLDRLLELQPEEPQLLRMRVGVLSSLERYPAAIRDLEVLARLRGANRGPLALEIADHALAYGDLDRASRALRDAGDPAAVAELYRKHRLYGAAIDALGGLGQGASDPTVAWIQRARLLRLEGRDEEAVHAFREALQRDPDLGSAVRELAELEHRLGHREEAVHWGSRLFAQIEIEHLRGTSVPPGRSPRREERRTKAALERARDWFLDRGYLNELSDLLEQEFERRPTSPLWLELVHGHFTSGAHRDIARLDRILEGAAAAARAGAAPPGAWTPGGWRSHLEELRRRAWEADPASASRLADGLLERARLGESTWFQGYRALVAAGRDGELPGVLEAALEASPEDLRLWALYAGAQRGEQDFEGALTAWDEVLRLRAEDPDRWEAEGRAREELRRAGFLDAIRRELPAPVTRGLTEAQAGGFYAWVEEGFFRGEPDADGWFDPRAAQLVRAEIQAKSGDPTGAEATLRGLLDAGEPTFPERVAIAEIAFRLGLGGLGEELYPRIEVLEAEALSDPVVGVLPDRLPSTTSLRTLYARTLDRRGEGVAAYELLRTAGNVGAARLLALEGDLWGELEERYRARLAQARLDLGRAGSPGVGPGDPEAPRESLRDAGIRLFEVICEQRRWEEARSLLAGLRADLPGDLGLMGTEALLLHREDRWEESVALELEIIEALQDRARAGASAALHRGRRIEATVVGTGGPPEVGRFWNAPRLLAGSPRSLRAQIGQHHLKVIRILLDHHQVPRAVDRIRRLQADDVTTFEHLLLSLDGLLRSYEFGASEIELRRMAHRHDPASARYALNYGEALRAAKRYPEAERVFTGMLAQGSSVDYYRGRARSALSEIRRVLGQNSADGIPELAERTAAEPKNVQHRLAYAEALYAAERWSEALDEARQTLALAPHLAEVQSLMDRCLAAAADLDGIEARLRDRYERSEVLTEQVLLAESLAEFAWARGDRDAVEALLDASVERSAGRHRSWSPAMWWLDHGEPEKARGILAGEIEAGVFAERQRPIARLLMTRLHLWAGDPIAAVDLGLPDVLHAGTPGEAQRAFLDWVPVLYTAPDVDVHAPRVLEEADRRGGLEGRLLRAMVAFATGDRAGFEAVIARALAEEEGAAFLLPIAISMARSRGDFARALELLDGQAPGQRGSTEREVRVPFGVLSERDTYHGERGVLLHALGRTEEALEAWAQLDRPGDAGRTRVLAKLLASQGLHELAIERLEGLIDEVGETQGADMASLGGVLMFAGRSEEALEVLERTAIVVPEDEREKLEIQTPRGIRTLGDAVFDLRIELGRAPARLESRLESARRDPADIAAWREAILLAEFLGETEAQREALEALANQPRPGVRDLMAYEDWLGREGDLAGALAQARRRIELASGGYPRAAGIVGVLRWTVRGAEPEAARTIFREALLEEPWGSNPEFLNQMIHSLVHNPWIDGDPRLEELAHLANHIVERELKNSCWTFRDAEETLKTYNRSPRWVLEQTLEGSARIDSQLAGGEGLADAERALGLRHGLGDLAEERTADREQFARWIRLLDAAASDAEVDRAIDLALTHFPDDLVFLAAGWRQATRRDDRVLAKEVAAQVLPRLQGGNHRARGAWKWLSSIQRYDRVWAHGEPRVDATRAPIESPWDPRLRVFSRRPSRIQGSITPSWIREPAELRALGDFKGAAEAARIRRIFGAGRRVGDPQYHELLAEAGEATRAERLLLSSIEVSSQLLDGSRGFDSIGNPALISSGPSEGAHRIALAEGRGAEFLESFRLRTIREPHRDDLLRMYHGMLAREERYADLSASLGELHRRKPLTPNGQSTWIDALSRAGKLEEALGLQRDLVQGGRRSPQEASRHRAIAIDGAPNRLRFTWASSQRITHGAAMFLGGSPSVAYYEKELLALLHATGRGDEARTLGERMDRESGVQQGGVLLGGVADRCSELGAFEASESVCRKLLASEDDARVELGLTSFELLAQRSGHRPWIEEALALRLERIEGTMEESPARTEARARARLEAGIELDRAREDWLACWPEGVDLGSVHRGFPKEFAQLEYLQGNFEKALALDLALRSHERGAGRIEPSEVRTRIGLCLDALGRRDEALPHLRRAWAEGIDGIPRALRNPLRTALGRPTRID